MSGCLETEHYLDPAVRVEIAKFSAGRWAAVFGRGKLVRYERGRPLTIRSEGDVARFARKLSARTFYATANVYAKLELKEDVAVEGNIVACAPTWDIDNRLEKWRATVAVAAAIVEFLREQGIEKSVFVKWSGEGCHVHVHELSISEELRKRRNPLDLAYAVVEYVNAKLEHRFLEIAEKYGAVELKVENKLDIQRLFTCPLSLHRELDRVCVCVKPDELTEFDISWTEPDSFVHYGSWDRYEEGEADELCERALEVVGPRPPTKRRRRKHPPLDEQIRKWLERGP